MMKTTLPADHGLHPKTKEILRKPQYYNFSPVTSVPRKDSMLEECSKGRGFLADYIYVADGYQVIPEVGDWVQIVDYFSEKPEPHWGLRLYRVGCNSSVGWIRRYHLEDRGCIGSERRLLDLPDPGAGVSLSGVVTEVGEWVDIVGRHAKKGRVEIVVVDIGSETED